MNMCNWYFVQFQSVIDFKTTVILRRCHWSVDIDISNRMEIFSPFLLVYLRDINTLDMSGCSKLDVNEVVDSLPWCSGLSKLVIRYCPQWEEKHLIRILPYMSYLSYVDMEGCQEVSTDAALWIPENYQHIRCWNFHPFKFGESYLQWQMILEKFIFVQFGHCVH